MDCSGRSEVEFTRSREAKLNDAEKEAEFEINESSSAECTFKGPIVAPSLHKIALSLDHREDKHELTQKLEKLLVKTDPTRSLVEGLYDPKSNPDT